MQLPSGFKTKWVQALRSGRYNQCAEMMHDPKSDAYDAIGVAYRVAGVNRKKIAYREVPTGKRHRFLPNVLSEESEIVQKISSFNDKGLSFKWIASYIENNL